MQQTRDNGWPNEFQKGRGPQSSASPRLPEHPQGWWLYHCSEPACKRSGHSSSPHSQARSVPVMKSASARSEGFWRSPCIVQAQSHKQETRSEHDCHISRSNWYLVVAGSQDYYQIDWGCHVSFWRCTNGTIFAECMVLWLTRRSARL